MVSKKVSKQAKSKVAKKKANKSDECFGLAGKWLSGKSKSSQGKCMGKKSCSASAGRKGKLKLKTKVKRKQIESASKQIDDSSSIAKAESSCTDQSSVSRAGTSTVEPNTCESSLKAGSTTAITHTASLLTAAGHLKEKENQEQAKQMRKSVRTMLKEERSSIFYQRLEDFGCSTKAEGSFEPFLADFVLTKISVEGLKLRCTLLQLLTELRMSTQNTLEKDESGYYEIVTRENLNAIINRTSNVQISKTRVPKFAGYSSFLIFTNRTGESKAGEASESSQTSNDKHKGKSTQIGPGPTSAIKVGEKLPSKSEPYPSEMRASQVFAPIRDINSDQFSDE